MGTWPGPQLGTATGSPRPRVTTIDPDGVFGPAFPFDVYCDQETAGGGWMLVAVYGMDGRPTSWSGNAFPRPGAADYGSLATAATEVVAIQGGASTASNYSFNAKSFWPSSNVDVLMFVGAGTADYALMEGLDTSACNLFDGSVSCPDAATGSTVTLSDGTVLTTGDRICTAVGSDDNEYGLHVLADAGTAGSCTDGTDTTVGWSGLGRVFTTFELNTVAIPAGFDGWIRGVTTWWTTVNASNNAPG